MRRDRALLDKAQKDKRSNQDKKSLDEIEDLQAKVGNIFLGRGTDLVTRL